MVFYMGKGMPHVQLITASHLQYIFFVSFMKQQHSNTAIYWIGELQITFLEPTVEGFGMLFDSIWLDLL